MGMRSEFPDYKDWSQAAVRLLQGVVESDDGRVWNVLLSNVSQLETHFVRLGLRLVIDESEGFAYLRQLTAEEAPDGYDTLPKLFRATRLSYGQTLACVLLRDVLRRFEEEETRDERFVVEELPLLDSWKVFFPGLNDEVKLRRDLRAALHKLEELGFVRQFGHAGESWEVRKILKARLNADTVQHLHQELIAAAQRLEPANAPADQT